MHTTYQLSFDQDVIVSTKENEEKSLLKSEELTVSSSEPILVRKLSKIALVIIPGPKQDGHFQIHLPKIDYVNESPEIKKETSQDFGEALNEATKDFVEIQMLIKEQKPDMALVKLQILKEKYPKFFYLRFLEASCYALKQDFSKARAMVESALEDYPEDPLGKKFLLEITSGSNLDSQNQTTKEVQP